VDEQAHNMAVAASASIARFIFSPFMRGRRRNSKFDPPTGFIGQTNAVYWSTADCQRATLRQSIPKASQTKRRLR
jgi:hypothetical protein